MKKLILISLIFLSGSLSYAQTGNESDDKRPVNNFNLTCLGNASLISLNYEYLYFVRPNFSIAFNLGVGYNEEFQIIVFGPKTPPKTYITLPHYVTGNVGNGRSFLEFGLGGTFMDSETQQHYYLYPIVGYRIQPLRKSRMYFRIFGELFSGYKDPEVYLFPGGFSLGFSF